MRQRNDHLDAVLLPELLGNLPCRLHHRPVPELFRPGWNRRDPIFLHKADDADLDAPFLCDPISPQRFGHGVGVRIDNVGEEPGEVGGMYELGQVGKAYRQSELTLYTHQSQSRGCPRKRSPP